MDLFDSDGSAYESGLFAVEQNPKLEQPAKNKPMSRTAAEHRKVARRIGTGIHPLGEPIRLHPDAPRDLDSAEAAVSESTGPRCGTCVFRVLVNLHRSNRPVPKCYIPTRIGDREIFPRDTRSETSDIAAWWPACTSWEVKP